MNPSLLRAIHVGVLHLGLGVLFLSVLAQGRTQCTIHLSDEEADEEDEAQHDAKIVNEYNGDELSLF